MKWSEINSNPAPRVLRQFGCAGFVILSILAGRQYWLGRHHLALGLAAAGLLLGICGLIRPASLRWLFVGWMKVVFPLNWVVSELTLALMFYAVLTPLALIFRLAGRDQLFLKATPEKTSFWVRKEPVSDVRRYFRQY